MTLLIYFAVPRGWKNGVLFLFSLVFYAWGEPVYVTLMLFATAFNYGCGRALGKGRGTPAAKRWVIASVVVNLALLGAVSYTHLLVASS